MAAGQIRRGRRRRTPSARGRTSDAEAVAGEHERHRATARGLGVHRRVADQHHRSALGVPAQRQQARRDRACAAAARRRPPPRRTRSRTLQRVEQPLGRPARLVGEHGERQQGIERAQRAPQARVEAGGVEQAIVVQREEAIERAGSPGVEAGRASGPAAPAAAAPSPTMPTTSTRVSGRPPSSTARALAAVARSAAESTSVPSRSKITAPVAAPFTRCTPFCGAARPAEPA